MAGAVAVSVLMACSKNDDITTTTTTTGSSSGSITVSAASTTSSNKLGPLQPVKIPPICLPITASAAL